MRTKKKKLINAVKIVVDGITFDSELEANFYRYLKVNVDKLQIQDIICHPTFHIIKPFEVTCWKCNGEGTQPSPVSDKMRKCYRCKGTGKRSRQGTDYTPDFLVIYQDQSLRYFDVKGGFVNERFPIIKKTFEKIIGQELIIITWDEKNKKWVWK